LRYQDLKKWIKVQILPVLFETKPILQQKSVIVVVPETKYFLLSNSLINYYDITDV
jgi:hypothetical protein